MDNSSLTQKVEALLCKYLDIPKEELKQDSNLSSDLNLDELERADLVANLEKDLNFTIEDKSALNQIHTLGDLIALVEENSNEF